MRSALNDIDMFTKSETSLHHDFSHSAAKASSIQAQRLYEYIKDNWNPLKSELDELPIRNIANGSENDGNFDFVMSYLHTGEEMYQKFVESRLVTKVDGLFATIKRNTPSKTLAERKKWIRSIQKQKP